MKSILITILFILLCFFVLDFLTPHLSFVRTPIISVRAGTACFMKTVPSVYNENYPSHSTQVAEGTVFRKHGMTTN